MLIIFAIRSGKMKAQGPEARLSAADGDEDRREPEQIKNDERKLKMMIRPGRMMDNARAKEIFAGKDLGKACSGCRFYDESLGTDLAICRRHKIRTNIAASCGDYDEKGVSGGALRI